MIKMLIFLNDFDILPILVNFNEPLNFNFFFWKITQRHVAVTKDIRKTILEIPQESLRLKKTLNVKQRIGL